MKLPRSGHGRLGLEVIELADTERPPMISIPEYLEKRRGEAGAGGGAAEPDAGDHAGRAGQAETGSFVAPSGGIRSEDET